ncbi:MAG: hypothetical protein GY869_07155, partial [Planctomycetes bacterium]|nr:hypothetical protein [Planctomycetota bacterium]
MFKQIKNVPAAAVTVFMAAMLMMLPSANAGELAPKGPPEKTEGYTIHDIYNRLKSGTPGPMDPRELDEIQRKGPQRSGPSVDEVMNIMPTIDDSNGLSPDEVPCGKTFWSKRSESWGEQIGTGDSTICYMDADGDGHGGNNNTVLACGECPTGSYQASTDCDDTDATVNPNAIDICEDSIDQDCNGYDKWCLSPFQKNDDGTTTDRRTGQVWMTNADCYGLNDWSYINQVLAPGIGDGDCGLT